MTGVAIIGAGIAGLTTALELHRQGIPARVYEANPVLEAVGVGINVMPHASRLLGELGLAPELERASILTRESVFFNRFGQLVYREPAGLAAGYAHPQYSIHRGELQRVLLDAVRERLGADSVRLGQQVVAVDDGPDGAIVRFEGGGPDERADAVLACDGVHSAVRRQLYPDEGPPRSTGITMWRGVTIGPPILSGASMVRAGWLSHGKLVHYPIRDLGDGTQLQNWLAEIELPTGVDRDWTRAGRLADFLPHYADWHFDWLDVPELFRRAELILEYPMVDQDPLPRWSFGRVTLVGDAAHPMVPRGSNGAGQAILDARAVAQCLAHVWAHDRAHVGAHGRADVPAALAEYERQRREATAQVVLTNRVNPPDAILREVYERSGDRPFDDVDDVISGAELAAMSLRYKQVAGMLPENC